jgi:hypothetical protein
MTRQVFVYLRILSWQPMNGPIRWPVILNEVKNLGELERARSRKEHNLLATVSLPVDLITNRLS